jgi:Lon protease-like protein
MTPLAIGQERSIALVDDVVGGERLLALVTVRDADVETPGWADLYSIGTAAVVHKMIRVPDGTLRVLVQGIRRVRLERRVLDDPYLVGEFVEFPCARRPKSRRAHAQRAGPVRAIGGRVRTRRRARSPPQAWRIRVRLPPRRLDAA